MTAEQESAGFSPVFPLCGSIVLQAPGRRAGKNRAVTLTHKLQGMG
jgi:hypothetical protein